MWTKLDNRDFNITNDTFINNSSDANARIVPGTDFNDSIVRTAGSEFVAQGNVL